MSRPVRASLCVIAVSTVIAATIALLNAGILPTGASPSGATASLTPPGLRTVPPARLVDTRLSHQTLGGGAILSVVVAGRAQIPGGAGAAVVHVTAVAGRHSAGYLRVFPAGAPVPPTSSVNFQPGQIASNSAIVQLGANGALSVYASTGGPVDVVIDVNGWFDVANGPGGFTALTQYRALDTRTVHDPITSSARAVPLAGIGGMPESVGAVVLNVTAVHPTGLIPLVVWGSGAPRPSTSNLNATPGSAVPSLVTSQVGSDGAVDVAAIGGSVDVVVDVLGYIVAGPPGVNGLQGVTPARLLDTRKGGGPYSQAMAHPLQIGGVSSVPPTASAALITLTLVQTKPATGYVVAWPSLTPRPGTSNANPRADTPVAQTVVVPIGDDGKIDLAYVGGSGHLVVDLVGYVVPAPVVPAVVPTTPASSDPQAVTTARQILASANKYAVQTWWPGTAQTLLHAPMASNQQSDANDSVRRLAMEAFALAASVSSGAYDPVAAGVPQSTALSIAANLIDAVASHHVSNRSGGWGFSWQSDMWASYAGRAGWMIWASLDPGTQLRVQRMVLAEADYILTLSPKYMVAADGTVRTSGDTGAEEDSWYALAPALAAAMMPQAPNRDMWLAKQEQMQIAAWAQPADLHSTQVVDGAALTSWLQGSNVNPDGSVTNHNRVAPDYATNIYQNVDTVEFAAMAGTAAPQSSLFGLGSVYRSQSSVQYAVPPYATPGGQIYDGQFSPADPARIYYPQGCDWGTGQEVPYALTDAAAGTFGFGADAPIAAADAETLHANAARAMQQRFSDGHMYLDSTEYTYVGREEHAAQLAAQLFLAYDLQGHWGVTSRDVRQGRAELPTGRTAPASRPEAIYRR